MRLLDGRPLAMASRLVIQAALVASLSSCNHEFISVKGYRTQPDAPSHRLHAGVGRREITPLPGYPMGGHSLGGRLSRGRWLPLYARAFYFQDASGGSLLMVSCDLFAIPAGLQQKVAELVNAKHPDISSRNFILAATHTHQGPGNFLSSTFYNNFASPMPGFDRPLFEWLAENIALAADDAITESAKPGDVQIRLTRANLHDLIDRDKIQRFARNRAVGAFLRNDPADRCSILYPDSTPDSCQCKPGPNGCPRNIVRERGFGDALDVLRITRRVGGVDHHVGALVFFGIHPTTIADHAAFYSSDFTGLAMTTIERSEAPGYVSGFFNGADGDVSPNWGRQDAADTIRISRDFQEAIGKATIPLMALGDEATIRVFRTAPKQRDFCKGNRPLMGIAAVGGAEDGRFVSFDMGWRAPSRLGNPYKKHSIFSRLGTWRLFTPAQRFKQPGLDYSASDLISLTAILAPPGDYPDKVPITAVRFGPMTLLAVPFEMTSVAALHVRRAAEETVGKPVILVGLANEYLSYVSSKAEFEEQDYEGASTLFGEDSELCIAGLLRSGLLSVSPPSGETIRKMTFDAGPPPLFDMHLGPGFWGKNPADSDASLESAFAGDSVVEMPRFEWTSDLPGRASIYQTAGGRWTQREDDDGGRMLLELVDGRRDRSSSSSVRRWNEIWLTPTAGGTASTIFVVRRDRPSLPICSSSFMPNDVEHGRVALPIGVGTCPAELER